MFAWLKAMDSAFNFVRVWLKTCHAALGNGHDISKSVKGLGLGYAVGLATLEHVQCVDMLCWAYQTHLAVDCLTLGLHP